MQSQTNLKVVISITPKRFHLKDRLMGYVQNQVGHSSINPIVNHYYNRIPRDEDGKKLEEAFKFTQVLPDLE